MKTYTALYAEDVPHYGIREIVASSDEQAIAIAKKQSVGSVAVDPDYENSVLRRIVHLEDETGRIVAEDIALDSCFLRYGGEAEEHRFESLPQLLEAIRTIAAIPLWGEELPASMLSLKQELIERDEYDPDSQTYAPCADAESTWLRDAVETARKALALIDGAAS